MEKLMSLNYTTLVDKITHTHINLINAEIYRNIIAL